MLLKAHYRQPLDWSDTTLEQAQRTLDGLYGTLRDLAEVDAGEPALPSELLAALADDLNTPEAMAIIAGLAENARKARGPSQKQAAKAALLGAGAFLGLLQQDPETWFKADFRRANMAADARVGVSASADLTILSAQEIDKLIEERDQARRDRNFGRADAIRDQLQKRGIAIEDGAGKTRWKVAAE
jgi:cysteinyl-tRNA synthetase